MTTIVTPEERLAEARGARIFLLGPNAIGKTTQVKTLADPTNILYIDADHGSLAIADTPVDHVRPETWREVQDIIARVTGPNRSFTPQEPYSQAHFDRVGGYFPKRYHTVVLDGLGPISRLCFRHVAQQPEALTERGRLDLRGVYGALARELLLALYHLQSARSTNIILMGVLEKHVDDYGRVEHRLQAEGQRVPREILGIVDIVVTYQWIDFGDGKQTRAFVCTSPNPWNYPAKDRSGKLDQIEEPDLGKLIHKILPPRAGQGAAVETQPSQQSSVVNFIKSTQQEEH